MDNVTTTETGGAAWKSLYRVGGVAALLAALVFRRSLGAEFDVSNGFGVFAMPETLPVSAPDWFAVLQAYRFVGLTLLGVFDLVEYVLVGLMFLALYGALRRTNRSALVIATVFGLIGIAVSLASNQALALAALSEQYAAASTETQRALLLAGGEALLAINQRGIGLYVSLFLVLLSGLIISIVMLRSAVFSKATAIAGILANGLGLAYFVTLAFAPAIIWLPPTLSAPFRLIWYVLIALKLFQLARREEK
ncbi:MAG: DUF4386 family protein [Anaerolineae bacterium]|nr:DUF4386 family protein [Anaerolineae bacterium]